MTEKYKNILANLIKEKCNNEGFYEICWDYRDEISPATIKEAVDQEDISPFDYISDTLLQINEVWTDNEMISCVKERIYDTGDAKLINEYHDSESFFEDLYDAGYKGIELNVNELLEKTELDVNITFATDQEQNYDMGSIVGAYGSYAFPDEDTCSTYLDNALTYLINQQGYTSKNIYDRLYENPEGWTTTDNFVDSVVNEIVNNSSEAMSELCILVKMNAKEYLEMIAKLRNKENFNLKFNKKSVVGIFNEWSGCGGPFEISLEKDFLVPSTMIRELMLDDATGKYTCGVGRVYGMSTGAWTDCCSYTNEEINVNMESDECEGTSQIRILFSSEEENVKAEKLLDELGIDYDYDSGDRMITDYEAASILGTHDIDFDII